MSGFFDDKEREENKTYKKTLVYFVAAISLVMLLFLAIIYANTKQKQDRRRALDEELQENAEELALDNDIEEIPEQGGMKSEDLDFWDMYDDDTGNIILSDNKTEPSQKKEKPEKKPVTSLSEDKIMPDNEDSIKEEKEEEDDGKHIKAKAKGEDAKWYDIHYECIYF